MKTPLPLSEIFNFFNSKNTTDINFEVFGLCSTEEPKNNHLTFFKGQSVQALQNKIKSVGNLVILVPKDFQSLQPSTNILIQVENPHKSFIEAIPLFYQATKTSFGVDQKSDIHSSVKIGEGSNVGPFTYIGPNTKIGKNTYIHPHVTIYNNVSIGDNCTIHSGAIIREDVEIGNNITIQNGAIIGADGFGYIPDPKVGLITVPQIGNVKLSDNVDIGANACIDRAALDSTRIGQGTKIDNLVQIGHNTQIGSFSIVCGQAAIAGSTKIGNQVILGGNVGVADHTEIADGCRFAAFSGLHGKYTERADYAGNPAMPAKLYRRVVASLLRLPKLVASLPKDSQTE